MTTLSARAMPCSAARPSGTEDVYKIYAESFRGGDHLRRIQREAQAIVSDALAGADAQS